jgi:hypothetical protein
VYFFEEGNKFLMDQLFKSGCGRASYHVGGSPSPCSLGLSATSQQYFSLTTNQPPATSQQYSSLRTNQHQPSATSQPNTLHARHEQVTG